MLTSSPLATHAPEGRTPAYEPGELLVRKLVHDLRQPLSTIETCASYLRLVLNEDAKKALEEVARIERQVEEASRLLSEAADRIRKAAPAPS